MVELKFLRIEGLAEKLFPLISQKFNAFSEILQLKLNLAILKGVSNPKGFGSLYKETKTVCLP